MVKTATKSVTNSTTIEQAFENDEIRAAICRGIFKITRLRKPPSVLTGAVSRDRLDWQDIFSKVVVKLSDPAVGFAAANFSPAFAFGVARNTAGEWLRERMKERPRRRAAEQEDETVAFQIMQFDPLLEPREQRDPEKNMIDVKAITAREDFLASLTLDFAKDVLERFAEMCPEDHAWLIEYLTTRRIKKHTPADHQRAVRLVKKLRELYDEMDQELEDDAEQAALEDDELELEAA